MSLPASKSLKTLLDILPRATEVRAAGLRGSAIALVAATLQQKLGGPLVLITPTVDDAEKLASDLSFFLERTLDGRVCPYPGWDVEPYDGLAPHTDIATTRIGALHALRTGARDSLIVAPAEAFLKKVIPLEVLRSSQLTLRVGEEHSRDALVRRLVELGYLTTDLVEDEGTFSVRGGVLDVFPPLHEQPIRIDFFGDEIDTIRAFDPTSQRSLRPLKTLELLPVREELLTPETVSRAAGALKELADALDRPSHVRRQLVEDLNQGIYFSGIEYHLGMLYPSLPTVLDYIPEKARVVLIEPAAIRTRLHEYHQQLQQHYARLDSRHLLVPPPETLFIEPEVLLARLDHFPRLLISDLTHVGRPGAPEVSFKLEPTSGLRQTLLSQSGDEGMLKPLVERFRRWFKEDLTTLIVCRSTTQARRLRDLLEPYDVFLPEPMPPLLLGEYADPPWPQTPTPLVLVGDISQGFRFPEGRLVLLTEEDIFGPRTRTATPGRQFLRNAVSSFSQLNRGDYVVQSSHGVGIFRGLVKLPMNGTENDFLWIEYEGGDKLYLPVHRLNTLQKYVGQGSAPKLDKMGGVTFARTRKKVKEAVLKMARELLDLYAARAVLRGHSFQLDRRAIEAFETSFPYDETPDQLAAIEAVYKDMASERPMDRLICGDVGYGKTEVAIRAAYAAALDGRQVVVLVPTTVLALQHFRSFSQRFAHTPVTVEMLNRFRTPVEQKQVLEGLKTGRVDVVVGTHRLLSQDVVYKNLGLMIVDEEHRFGVSHKERIKRLRKNLDVLTMTATPIPRTLHMSLSGLREFSLITTPPRDRLAIRTYHVTFSPTQIQEAIRHELKRGGQVYFVHNRVQSIFAMARLLQELVPEANVGVAHGQMDESRLEKIMVDFIERRHDILCCTSIVESGLDIPGANTILINRADRFGLAQLYQLRGRVGRSSRRAFCYLLTPANQTLTPVMERRLNTLVNNTELGSGIKIASEDLEMRGAGDILGTSQSGNINAVGMDMYCELLEKAIQELKGEEVVEEFEPDIDLKLPAYFPESYIPELHSRLDYYKRLSDARDETTLYERLEEVEDRFGPLPEEVKNLLELMKLRLSLRELRVRSATVSGGRLSIRFDDSSRFDRNKLVRLVSQESKRYKLTPDQRLVVLLNEEEQRNLARLVKNLLQNLK